MFKKVLGYGLLVYVVAFIVASIFVAYGSTESTLATWAVLIAVLVAVLFASKRLGVQTGGEAFKYSLGMLIIVAILDLVLTVPFTGMEIYSTWHIWVGYLLILFVPVLTSKLR